MINRLAANVKVKVLQCMQKSRHYTLLFHSSPDNAHRDQLSRVMKYVKFDLVKWAVCVHASFLRFTKLEEKDAASLVDSISKELETDGMELCNIESEECNATAVRSRKVPL